MSRKKKPEKMATRREYRVATALCVLAAAGTVIAAAVILDKGHPLAAAGAFIVAAVLVFAGSLTAYNARNGRK